MSATESAGKCVPMWVIAQLHRCAWQRPGAVKWIQELVSAWQGLSCEEKSCPKESKCSQVERRVCAWQGSKCEKKAAPQRRPCAVQRMGGCVCVCLAQLCDTDGCCLGLLLLLTPGAIGDGYRDGASAQNRRFNCCSWHLVPSVVVTSDGASAHDMDTGGDGASAFCCF
eukprot:1161046-Pelagomonas_calceolata.AAC.8